jgi:DNA repair protein RadC
MVQCVREALREKYGAEKIVVSCPDDIGPELVARVGYQEYETVGIVWMDASGQVLEIDDAMFRGTVDQSVAHPRELVKRGLELNAARCIMFHNHPSGTTRPSVDDLRFTDAAAAALDLFGIHLLDHLVIGGGDYVSLLPVNTLIHHHGLDPADAIQRAVDDELI